jgi:DNA-binding NarL/FixJ family response regulator
MSRQCPRILSIGSDVILLESRNRVLESAGFEVVGSLQAPDAFLRFETEPFDAVVLGDSMPWQARVEFLRSLKNRKPLIPVVVLYRADDRGEELREADALCGSLDGPEQLINTVAAVVGFAPQSRPAPFQRFSSAR